MSDYSLFFEIGFWVCLGLVAYIYVGYFAGAFLLAKILNRNVTKANCEPNITVVISAFNEEREIESTVINKLSQDYPSDRLNVIVVSDGSTDRTDQIVQYLADRSKGRLRLLRQEPRGGKTQALNFALRHASSEIVVLADANSMYAPDAVRSLARNFADPSVGYVTGQMVYTNPSTTGIGSGSGSYMSYENELRKSETKLGSIVGVDGGIDAVRRELYIPMRPDQLPDFVLPLSIVEQGRRVVYEPNAIVYETALSNPTAEFRMRVRVSLRALWALYDKRNVFNPVRYPLVSWQLFSHKVLRYIAFLPILGLLLCNMSVASQHRFYFWLLVLQLMCYTTAVCGHLIRQWSGVPPKILIPYYFVILNAACMMAFWKFIQGQKMVLWTPRVGA